jgi:hypothetical protein
VADAAAPCGIRRLGESSWKQRFPQRTSSSDSFGHKTRRRNCAGPSTALFFGFSVHFADLHILVNGERGIADGRTRGGRSVTCRDAEVATRTLDGISIAVPLATRHGQGVRGNELVERSAMAVLRDVAALPLGNLHKIAAHASQADCLRRGRAFIAHRHLLEIVVIHAKEKSTRNENRDQGTHTRSLALDSSAGKSGAKDACASKQQNSFTALRMALLLNLSRLRPARAMTGHSSPPLLGGRLLGKTGERLHSEVGLDGRAVRGCSIRNVATAQAPRGFQLTD